VRAYLPSLDWVLQNVANLIVPFALAVYQTAGITIESGNQGLKFSLGRATRVLEPGFYPLIPYLQTVREVPSRARTLNPPTQRVVTRRGLVYDVDANLTWRIVDIEAALVEVKDVETGLRDALAIGVQEVVSRATDREVRNPAVLDRRLTQRLSRQAERWGVAIEEAGFVTLAPTHETLRITQLAGVVASRADAWRALVDAGMTPRQALASVGMRRRFVRRERVRRPAERTARWRTERDVARARLASWRKPTSSLQQLLRWLFGPTWSSGSPARSEGPAIAVSTDVGLP
jgi:regulator of protease activity HflC (stomatin/prohibitin superfamily)